MLWEVTVVCGTFVHLRVPCMASKLWVMSWLLWRNLCIDKLKHILIVTKSPWRHIALLSTFLEKRFVHRLRQHRSVHILFLYHGYPLRRCGLWPIISCSGSLWCCNPSLWTVCFLLCNHLLSQVLYSLLSYKGFFALLSRVGLMCIFHHSKLLLWQPFKQVFGCWSFHQ